MDGGMSLALKGLVIYTQVCYSPSPCDEGGEFLWTFVNEEGDVGSILRY